MTDTTDVVQSEDTDVVILGGGLAGLSLAIQLKGQDPDLRITVLEQRRHPVPEAAFKVGESSVEIGAHYFADLLGCRKHLEAEHYPKLGLRYFFDSTSGEGPFSDRVECGGNEFFPAGSFQIDRGRFENHLGAKALELGVDFLTGARVLDVSPDNQTGHQVRYRRSGQQVLCRAQWLVDASGRAGIVRSRFGWTREVPHKVSSVWFRIKGEVRVDDWSDNPRWTRSGDVGGRRWLSTNHLMGEGYWVWLIPLASGSTSIGIVADESVHPSETYYPLERTLEWLEAHEPECARQLRPFHDKVQDVLIETEVAHDCQPVFADRMAVTGEAGLFLDPFYSPGSDFIALSNTYISELIQRDRRGKPVAQAAKLYDQIYHLFYSNNLCLYHRQYPLFGNAWVMPLKIIWDFAYYWSIPASLFFHHRLLDLSLFVMEEALFTRVSKLNATMQEKFRHWHEFKPNPKARYHFVDITQLPFLRELNSSLIQDVSKEAFSERLKAHAKQLEVLAAEIFHAAAENKLPDADAATASVAPVHELKLLSPWQSMVGDAFSDPETG